MPYIPQHQRTQYDAAIQQISTLLSEQTDNDLPGHLNFVVSSVMSNVLKQKGVRYFRINALIGAIEACKLEMYRRTAGPYEDGACSKNGDI